ncbi:MAG TPA: alpha/beta hydrolase [Thermoanaerobaculia bacterium]|jgi:fermentation-respiration switch protein FrsA (DUF1100 family)|nr:alpha/beta hydrolase [Thermoanaerobaculia bacterium]
MRYACRRCDVVVRATPQGQALLRRRHRRPQRKVADRHARRETLQRGRLHPPELAKQSDAILKNLEAGKTTDNTPPELAAIYRPSVQPYLISWFRYDPAKSIAALTILVLIIQGTTDLQVSVVDAKRLAAANPKAKLLLIEGMNHVLKEVPDDRDKQIASYSNPDLRLAPEFLVGIVDFVRKVGK